MTDGYTARVAEGSGAATRPHSALATCAPRAGRRTSRRRNWFGRPIRDRPIAGRLLRKGEEKNTADVDLTEQGILKEQRTRREVELKARGRHIASEATDEE